jgi:DNA-binding SARP family transcriptional activator
MEFRILGPLEVRARGEAVPLGGTRQRAVLLLLLLHANDVVPAERLIDDLWGQRAPATAAHGVQVYVSNLRKLLAQTGDDGRLVSRSPGYVLRVEPGELDLERFERLVADARSALRDGAAPAAAETLREALALWRGSPLVDFAYEVFAQAPIARLEELRLVATEERIDADLLCGRHRELVSELEALAAAHPLRERLHGQLMLALYRSGRQAEALEVFQQARRVLVDELGIDPTPKLQQLELAILRQDPALDAMPDQPTGASVPAAPSSADRRSILLSVRDTAALDALVSLVGPLAVAPAPHELIVVQLTPPAASSELGRVAADLAERKSLLTRHGAETRVAAFSSAEPGHDLVRFASHEEVDLLLVCVGRPALADGRIPDELSVTFSAAPCDVAAVVGDVSVDSVAAVLVPFGGNEHDWAALELGAWFASAHRSTLRLAGTLGAPDGRDASRLLAHASLAVQQLVDVHAEPVLLEPGADGLLAAAGDASLLVVGIVDTWRQDGLGATRAALAARSPVPTLFVRGGLRPGGLAPAENLTRFTWSIGVTG